MVDGERGQHVVRALLDVELADDATVDAENLDRGAGEQVEGAREACLDRVAVGGAEGRAAGRDDGEYGKQGQCRPAGARHRFTSWVWRAWASRPVRNTVSRPQVVDAVLAVVWRGLVVLLVVRSGAGIGLRTVGGGLLSGPVTVGVGAEQLGQQRVSVAAASQDGLDAHLAEPRGEHVAPLARVVLLAVDVADGGEAVEADLQVGQGVREVDLVAVDDVQGRGQVRDDTIDLGATFLDEVGRDRGRVGGLDQQALDLVLLGQQGVQGHLEVVDHLQDLVVA